MAEQLNLSTWEDHVKLWRKKYKKIDVDPSDGRTRYNGKKLAELPFREAYPITISGLEDAELRQELTDKRLAVKLCLDEQIRRRSAKSKKG